MRSHRSSLPTVSLQPLRYATTVLIAGAIVVSNTYRTTNGLPR
jgi:hypothetical protein